MKRVICIISGLFLLPSILAFAQQDCGVIKLDEARKAYAIGHFTEVIALLQPCLKEGFIQKEQEQAFKYLALADIAVDSLKQASFYVQRLLEINPNFEPDNVFDPPRFIRLVDEMKSSGREMLVSSVSKKNENVLKAPATVTLITEEDIVRRGYLDLEQIFHDLSGFDIAKGRGPVYSNLYQRGYRSISNDRTVILIDGIEQNDLASDHAPISRQYPLSNIKRIEIIYGPASTIYGANAFVGVINIVTKSNYELLKKHQHVGLNAFANYGTFDSRNVDATLTTRSKDFSISLTGRYFSSDELDISGYDYWRLNLQQVDYAKILNITGVNAQQEYLADLYVKKNKLDALPPNPYYTLHYDGPVATGITLTESGQQKAGSLDEMGLNPVPGKKPLGLDRQTQDWYARTKIQAGDFTLSAETWRTNEGSGPWYTKEAYVFRQGAMRWITWNTNLVLNYEKRLNDQVHLNLISSYRLHAIDGGTNFQTFSGFYNNRYSFLELATNKMPVIIPSHYYRTSNQIKNEVRLLWLPLTNLEIMNGLEFRNSLIQMDYAKSSDEYPDENGLVDKNGIKGADYFRTFDIGLYSQGTYRYRPNVNLVLGGRLDRNIIRQTGGYGYVFNPRAAVIYSPGKFIFKAIFATAFKDASFLQKYATTSTRQLNNPGLKPERVRNMDLSAHWQITNTFSVNTVFFRAHYSGVVGVATVPFNGGTTSQFQDLGNQETYGAQAEVKYSYANYSGWGNYTYTHPIDQQTGKRISDIASNNFNLGLTGTYYKNLQINLITNFVGERKSGIGTSGSLNPITSFPAYNIYHLNMGYNNLWGILNFHIKIANLFDKNYLDPGVREASGVYAPFLPQAKRTITCRIQYKL
jgi:outer membrane receptor for ferrienterochelin and colicins